MRAAAFFAVGGRAAGEQGSWPTDNDGAFKLAGKAAKVRQSVRVRRKLTGGGAIDEVQERVEGR